MEITDCIAELSLKYAKNPSLRRPSFSFTYSFKLTYVSTVYI